MTKQFKKNKYSEFFFFFLRREHVNNFSCIFMTKFTYFYIKYFAIFQITIVISNKNIWTIKTIFLTIKWPDVKKKVFLQILLLLNINIYLPIFYIGHKTLHF